MLLLFSWKKTFFYILLFTHKFFPLTTTFPFGWLCSIQKMHTATLIVMGWKPEEHLFIFFNDDDDALESLISVLPLPLPLIILYALTRSGKWNNKSHTILEVGGGESFAWQSFIVASETEKFLSFFIFCVCTLSLNYIKNEHFLNSLGGAFCFSIPSCDYLLLNCQWTPLFVFISISCCDYCQRAIKKIY